ncbi:MAG TPA: hypothetical protein VG759_21475 [Candidatus Angelobacter sp.]|jgi:hypothetical protein|nr:hypothetical protein [Candidatus Angelobacter sp.]
MANRYVAFYEDGDGTLHASPDPLRVNCGDQVVWTNGTSGEYQVTQFSPAQPALFSSESICLPDNDVSAPVTVKANPAPGISMRYKYSCVSTGPDGKVLDPIIIVDPPGGDR